MYKQLWIAAVLATPVFFAAPAFAQQCTGDAECAEGEQCLYMTPCAMPDCPPDSECPEVECFGECGVWESTMVGGCTTDAECGDGFTCETESYESCAGSPPCPAGKACPDPVEPDCTSEEYSYCAPAPCASDADCGEGRVCESYTYDMCGDMTDVACAEGEECAEPTPREDVECETVTESYCAPPYVAPCAVDADCGEGFLCREIEACACSGGGGTEPADAGSSEPSGGSRKDAGDPDCTCEATGEFYCEPQYIECDAAADCPTEWSCETAVTGAPCFIEEDGTEVCPEPETGTGACTPPYWESWGAPAESRDQGGYEESLGDVLGGEGEPTADNGAGGDGGTGGSTDSGNASGGGCAAAPGTTGFGWLAGLAALVAFRRRRNA